MWSAYEISYVFYVMDTNSSGLTDSKLIILATIELIFNLSSMVLVALLFYMMD